MFSHCLGALCDYHHLGATFSCCCCLGTVFGCRCHGATFVCRRHDMIFIYVRMIQMSKVYQINDNKSNQWLSIYCIT